MITTLKRRSTTGMSSCMISSIQQKMTIDNFMTGYKDQVRNLLGKYDTYSLLLGARQNGSLMEITEGIFEEKMMTDSLDEVLKNLCFGESIWIRGREKSGERKYLVGRVTNTITEGNQERNLWDIKHQKLLNEAKFNPSKAQKWLGNRQNHRAFWTGNYNIKDIELITIAFGWIEEVIAVMDEWKSIDDVIDFLHNDAPEGFPKYAEDEYNGPDDIQKVEWPLFFFDVAQELKKLYK